MAFTDVAQASGIVFFNNDTQGYLIGGGVGLLDYDLDGRLDVFCVNSDGPDALFRQLPGGLFANVTATALPPGTGGFGSGVAAGDTDNDGDPDVYVVRNGANSLLRNNGNGTFTDVTALSGPGLADPAFGASAAMGDVDGDGFLDIYVANYVQSFNFPYHTGWPNRLFRNLGNGTFAEISGPAGVGAGISTSLACVFSDTDGDRDSDILLGNDFGQTVVPNRLYRNDGPLPAPAFVAMTDITAVAGMGLAIYCMGIAPGDYDNDGDIDQYFTNLGANVLLRNDGGNIFADVTAQAGVANAANPWQPSMLVASWSAGFADFDLDGLQDLYVSNGHIPANSPIANAIMTPNALFRNQGGGTFADVSATAGIMDPSLGRGAAFGDIDDDGDVDILQGNIYAATILWRNDTPRGANRFLRLRLEGRRTNRDAVGSRIRVTAGGVTGTQEVFTGTGFESASERARTFGLGPAAEADHVHVSWLSGTEQHLYAVPGNLRLVLVEPSVSFGAVAVATPVIAPGGAFQASFPLLNADTTPRVAQFDLWARLGPYILPLHPVTTTVPGGGSTVLGVTIPIPGGFTPPPGGVPITLFALLSGGPGELDMRRIDITLQ